MKGSNKIQWQLHLTNYMLLTTFFFSRSQTTSSSAAASPETASGSLPGRTTFQIFPHVSTNWRTAESHSPPQSHVERPWDWNGHRSSLKCTASKLEHQAGSLGSRMSEKTLRKWEITFCEIWCNTYNTKAWLPGFNQKTSTDGLSSRKRWSNRGTLSSSVFLEPDLAPYKTASLHHPNTIQHHFYIVSYNRI